MIMQEHLEELVGRNVTIHHKYGWASGLLERVGNRFGLTITDRLSIRFTAEDVYENDEYAYSNYISLK